MRNIIPFFVLLAILLTICVLVISFFNFRLRKYILENRSVDENVMKLLSNLSTIGLDSLKWGIILLFGGIGLIILEFIPYYGDSPLPFGLEAVFLALGFLVYYFASRNRRK